VADECPVVVAQGEVVEKRARRLHRPERAVGRKALRGRTADPAQTSFVVRLHERISHRTPVRGSSSAPHFTAVPGKATKVIIADGMRPLRMCPPSRGDQLHADYNEVIFAWCVVT
jgi:hypothetical protein